VSEQADKLPRWEHVAVSATMPLREADVLRPEEVAHEFHLADAAGERIGRAVAVVDARRRLMTIRAIRYDANRATEAEAKRALERLVGSHR
jgi:hypothetical protein